MDEEIKILEDFIKYFEAEAISTKYRRNIGITVGEDDIQAIENLIKGYRELEKEYERVRAARNWLSERISAQISTPEIFDKILEENYIPKSKIKEKIEEYQANMKKYEYADKNIFNENNIRQEVITVLTELLMEDK